MRNQKMIVTIFLLGMFITGCSSKSMTNDMAMPQEAAKEEMAQSEALDVEGQLEISEHGPRKNENQKLIYRANRYLEVTQKIEPLVLGLQQFVDAHNGYIEHMEQYRNGYDPVTQEQLDGIIMRIRIPHKHYEKTLTTIDELGTVINKSSSVEDVTLQYSDLESTLKMYKVEQERLLKMMENATTDIKDMIEIEKRLSEVRIEIEKQESARRALESQINYDTIDIEINQVRTVSNINQTQNFGTRIKVTFMKSVDHVKIFMQNLTLGITYIFIPLSIILLIIGVGYFIVSKIIHMRKSKNKPTQGSEEDD